MASPWLTPLADWFKLNVLPPVGAAIIRALGRSMRIDTRGQEHVDRLYREGKRVIIAFWHARQLMMPLTYRGSLAHILISQHRDGEIIARIVERFGFRAVRGSSTRGGVEALRELIRLGRSGVDLVVTPDGPKGPPLVAKMGVIQLARASRLPIIPLAFSCSKKNFSRAGTDSWCPIPARAASSCGGRPYGSRPMPTRRSWKPNVLSWKGC
ncbi:MAG TPA: lysophospholipid acyltransferase family protein [Nitrospira sp.]|nr:lysophospholipid acyltransferase family protein [Nitrospira sp.]